MLRYLVDGIHCVVDLPAPWCLLVQRLLEDGVGRFVVMGRSSGCLIDVLYRGGVWGGGEAGRKGEGACCLLGKRFIHITIAMYMYLWVNCHFSPSHTYSSPINMYANSKGFVRVHVHECMCEKPTETFPDLIFLLEEKEVRGTVFKNSL